jgi:hypothetical protein
MWPVCIFDFATKSLHVETYLQTTQDGKIEHTGVASTVNAADDSGN